MKRINGLSSYWDQLKLGDEALFRVEPDHRLDFFVGISATGKKRFIFESDSGAFDTGSLPKLHNIDIYIGLHSNRQQLILELSDHAFSDIFYIVCFDLTNASSHSKTIEGAIAIFISRLNRWADMLKKRIENGLGFNERLGLLGELQFILMLFERHFDVGAVITGWRGPNGDSKDLGLNNARVEIKSQIATKAATIKISSLDQLETDGRNLFIALLRFLPSEEGFSIKKLVVSIENYILNDRVVISEFYTKLIMAGYDSDSLSFEENFTLDNALSYAVKDEFPRLTRSNVPFAIIDANYRIGCEYLQEYKISIEDLYEGLR